MPNDLAASGRRRLNRVLNKAQSKTTGKLNSNFRRGMRRTESLERQGLASSPLLLPRVLLCLILLTLLIVVLVLLLSQCWLTLMLALVPALPHTEWLVLPPLIWLELMLPLPLSQPQLLRLQSSL
jgi:hypothetical protein